MTEWTNTDLANACVELGVLLYAPAYAMNSEYWQIPDTNTCFGKAEEVANDWRVAGAMMEKCLYEGYEIRMLRNIDEWSVVVMSFADVIGRSEGNADAHSIIEATVEALT